jgi:glycerol-3-phosphate dehydrogenase
MPMGDLDINIEYSSAIKDKLTEKRKLQKLWQTNKCPVMKNKLNRAIKALKNLLDSEKNQEIQEYLSKLSAILETNYFLWKATKGLKRLQTQYPDEQYPDKLVPICSISRFGQLRIKGPKVQG